MRPLAWGLWAAIEAIPSSCRGSSELRAGRFALQLFGNRCARVVRKMLFYRCNAPRPPRNAATIPARFGILFGGVVLGKTCLDATGGVIQQSD